MTVLDADSFQKFLTHFTDTLTPDLAAQFSNMSSDAKFQARLDVLGAKANEGCLSDEERAEYDTYIEAMDVVAIMRARAAASRKNDE